MKHIFLIILSVSLSLTTLLAQDVWHYVTVPEGIRISSMATDTNGTILLGVMNDATGEAGVYRKFYDDTNWEKIFTLDNMSVKSVDLSNGGDIYAGTNYSNSLFHSHDNGITWDTVSFPEHGNIMEIKCIGIDTVFISLWTTTGTFVLRSIDKGYTWQVSLTSNHSSEYATDIIQAADGSLYAGTMGFFDNQGGVYKSTDGGDNWQFIGLNNCQIEALAFNSKGDLFAGSWGGFGNETGGVYILRNGTDTWIPPLYGYPISGMVINSEDVIYCSSNLLIGVVRSIDDGVTFELYNSGLGYTQRENIIIDKDEYLYADNLYTLAKTVNTTVSNEQFCTSDKLNITVYPNPCSNQHLLTVVWDPAIKDKLIVQVFDMKGKVAIEKKLTRSIVSSQNIDVASLPKGTYILRLVSKNKIYKTGFVKL